MFEIAFEKAGKRYNRDWIFKNLDFRFSTGIGYVILGGNGSGKSTALKALAGYATLSDGNVHYRSDTEILKQSEIYKHISFCSPYLELYEELTLREMAAFHFSLKPMFPGLEVNEFPDLIGLSDAVNKEVKFFSSGMKQRVRIGLAVLSDAEVVFLDEPHSNLDQNAKNWYRNLVAEYRKDRIFVIASNHQEEEYFFCEEKLNIEDFKPS